MQHHIVVGKRHRFGLLLRHWFTHTHTATVRSQRETHIRERETFSSSSSFRLFRFFPIPSPFPFPVCISSCFSFLLLLFLSSSSFSFFFFFFFFFLLLLLPSGLLLLLLYSPLTIFLRLFQNGQKRCPGKSISHDDDEWAEPHGTIQRISFTERERERHTHKQLLRRVFLAAINNRIAGSSAKE